MNSFFNYLILCFLFYFYSTVKSSQPFCYSVISMSDHYNHIKIKTDGKNVNIPGIQRGYSIFSNITFKDTQLTNPIDVYGRVDFIFGTYSISVGNGNILIKYKSAELIYNTFVIPYDMQKQYFTISYNSEAIPPYHVEVKNVYKDTLIKEEDKFSKSNELNELIDTKNQNHSKNVQISNNLLEDKKSNIPNKKSFFLRPVVWGGFAVSTFLIALFYWKYCVAV